MKKKLTVLFVLVALLSMCIPAVSYASYGNTMPLYASGSSDTIIYIKRPESHSASTSDQTYTISAVGAQGTAIRIYKYSPAAGVCNLIKGTTYIGASGFFSTVVSLNEDNNIFMVYAENAWGNQVTRIDISKIRKSTVDKLKNVTVTMKNFLG